MFFVGNSGVCVCLQHTHTNRHKAPQSGALVSTENYYMLFMVAEQKDSSDSFQEIKLWRAGCRVLDALKCSRSDFIIYV